MHLTTIDYNSLECPGPVPVLEHSGLSIVERDVAHCELLVPNKHSILP